MTLSLRSEIDVSDENKEHISEIGDMSPESLFEIIVDDADPLIKRLSFTFEESDAKKLEKRNKQFIPRKDDVLGFVTEDFAVPPFLNNITHLSDLYIHKSLIQEWYSIRGQKFPLSIDPSYLTIQGKVGPIKETTNIIQRPFLQSLFGYEDILFNRLSPTNERHLRQIVLLHLVNHVVKSRELIVSHNSVLSEKKQSGRDKDDELLTEYGQLHRLDESRASKTSKSAPSSSSESTSQPNKYRDQGFVRPRILIICATRNAAYELVNDYLLKLIPSIHRGNISLGAKFNRLFGPEPEEEEDEEREEKGEDEDEDMDVEEENDELGEEDEGEEDGGEVKKIKRRFKSSHKKNMKPQPIQTVSEKPESFKRTFKGNVDETFCFGVGLTRRSVKLLCNLSDADFIIASPAGLSSVLRGRSVPDGETDLNPEDSHKRGRGRRGRGRGGRGGRGGGRGGRSDRGGRGGRGGKGGRKGNNEDYANEKFRRHTVKFSLTPRALLSSIEIAFVENATPLLMQNWEHINNIFSSPFRSVSTSAFSKTRRLSESEGEEVDEEIGAEKKKRKKDEEDSESKESKESEEIEESGESGESGESEQSESSSEKSSSTSDKNQSEESSESDEFDVSKQIWSGLKAKSTTLPSETLPKRKHPCLHTTPKNLQSIDMSRVYIQMLRGMGKFLRQTIIFSESETPELNSLFRQSEFVCNALGGGLKVPPLPNKECIRTTMPIVFQRLHSTNAEKAEDMRYNFFIKQLLPLLRPVSRSATTPSGAPLPPRPRTLVYFPSFFSFVRVRDFLQRRFPSLTSSSTKHPLFAEACEYTETPDLTKGRVSFFDGRTRLLLYTERLHFYRRYEFRKVERVLFYGPPSNREFCSDIMRMLERGIEEENDDRRLRRKVLRKTMMGGTKKASKKKRTRKANRMELSGGADSDSDSDQSSSSDSESEEDLEDLDDIDDPSLLPIVPSSSFSNAGSALLLFSPFDVHALDRIAGTKLCQKMVSLSADDSFVILTSDKHKE
ncbi:putative U3 small nucleolar RNA-associated protein 25 [Monocercomonoides exilis]|uniref:putative U3 small nucleolar RNA-associated protein 25 n=1 Tax=Monocercomonoides exilis TaxID=2049356 RepID=UPI0035594855|nr:putative U3 small nucleolar RNA-associated protein 25 [Monocercomonoides exilis]|eukprot:MONOS_3440.1-p1 / transcript=MONOS_3440.1 / gene=MONOS_3440 / organism=Monocercomonoides_exilis_PA203 / gene_product=nucleolus protein required for cell viability, putative / transcript_product=nucleolus protein required for cell viability, putative / location=Mono_scaffold00081:54785-57952(+) / protein_length=1008 / sequence_SO=supercontig / SO=protein_coding / is_pseudo=false